MAKNIQKRAGNVFSSAKKVLGQAGRVHCSAKNIQKRAANLLNPLLSGGKRLTYSTNLKRIDAKGLVAVLQANIHRSPQAVLLLCRELLKGYANENVIKIVVVHQPDHLHGDIGEGSDFG